MSLQRKTPFWNYTFNFFMTLQYFGDLIFLV